MKLVMVVTKLTGNEENDRARAQEYCRYAAHKGVIPVSAYLVIQHPRCSRSFLYSSN